MLTTSSAWKTFCLDVYLDVPLCCIKIFTKHKLLRETFPDHPHKYLSHHHTLYLSSILSTDHYLSLYDTLGCVFIYVSHTPGRQAYFLFPQCYTPRLFKQLVSKQRKKVNLLPHVPGFITLPITLQGLKTYWYIWSKLWCKL